MLKNSDKVVIVTTTKYTSKKGDIVRARLAEKTIRHATELGYEILVLDGGSSDDLLKSFEKDGARIYLQNSKTMGGSRRELIQEAYKTEKEIILWVEPEKEPFIPLIQKTIESLIDNTSDLVIPRRKSLESYPLFQQYSEKLANLYLKELMGVDWDICFGPKAWKREMSHYFLDYNGEYGDLWESLQIPMLNMFFDGKRIKEEYLDYVHPREQTEVERNNYEFNKKRIEQFTKTINTFESYWKNFQAGKI